MVLRKENLIKVFLYITSKLTGAGFLLLVMSVYLLLATGFDLYEFVEGISHVFLWFIVFAYGILCSVIIDLLKFKIPKENHAIRIILYIVAGYAFFMLREINVFMFVAGTVGALCSLIFYFGTYQSFRFSII